MISICISGSQCIVAHSALSADVLLIHVENVNMITDSVQNYSENTVTNSVQNLRKNTKQKQSKHGPLQKSVVGSCAIEE